MATLVPYTNCQLATQIDGTDCLGDSRLTINKNFSAIEVATCALSSNLLSSQRIVNSSLLTNLTSLSSQTLVLSSTVTTINRSFNADNVGPLDTLGTLVSALSVFDTSGSYIGYVPIYQ
jgi:hypothetical protein